jgi:hypothetical protein
VQEAQEAMQSPPEDVFTMDELPRFRRCTAAGTYDHSRAVFVGPRPIRSGGGVIPHEALAHGPLLGLTSRWRSAHPSRPVPACRLSQPFQRSPTQLLPAVSR